MQPAHAKLRTLTAVVYFGQKRRAHFHLGAIQRGFINRPEAKHSLLCIWTGFYGIEGHSANLGAPLEGVEDVML